MNKEEFLEEFKDILDAEEDLKEDMSLEDLEYDSLAILGLMSVFEAEGIDLPIDKYEEFKTVADVLKAFESK